MIFLMTSFTYEHDVRVECVSMIELIIFGILIFDCCEYIQWSCRLNINILMFDCCE